MFERFSPRQEQPQNDLEKSKNRLGDLIRSEAAGENEEMMRVLEQYQGGDLEGALLAFEEYVQSWEDSSEKENTLREVAGLKGFIVSQG